MKYFFHLLLILLAAFILAGVYEIYVVRDGNVARNDVFEGTIQDGGGWDKVLNGESTVSLAGIFDTLKGVRLASVGKEGKVTDNLNDEKEKLINPQENVEVGEENEKNEEAETPLMSVYRLGVLANNSSQIDLSSSARYKVIEFCTPGVEICKASYEANMMEYFEQEIGSLEYERQPYLANFGGVDESVWAGVACVEEDMKLAYLDEIYKSKKITNDTLPLISKKLKLLDIDACIAQTNIRFGLRNSMGIAKQEFGINALPTYIVIDTEENKWLSIPGLYEKNEITTVLEKEFPLLARD